MGRLVNDISLTFSRFGEQELGSFGRLINNECVPITTKGSLQPLEDGDLALLREEGKRIDGSRIYYTNTKLKGADPYNNTQADETTYDGVELEVFDSGDWNTTAILKRVKHYRYILVRKEEGDGGQEDPNGFGC